MKETSAAQVVLEEVARAAIDAARALVGRGPGLSAFEMGQLMGYYDLLDVLKEQAGLQELDFFDQTITDFDPDELLVLMGRASALKHDHEEEPE